MAAEQVNLPIREGEGLTVEFKERYTSRIDEDIVVFANAKGGTLLLGVRDNGTITGESLTNDLKAKINSMARNCKAERIGMDIQKMRETMAAAGLREPTFEPAKFFRQNH